MIRVLNIISDANIGGAGRVLVNYLQYSDKTKYETLVAVPRGSLLKEPLTALGATVHEVDGINARSFAVEDVKTLTALIRAVKPDIVHTHGALSGRIAAKRCGVKIVYTRHCAFPVPKKLKYPPGRWLNRWLNVHYADRIIAVSPATAENLTDSGVPEKKITVMMNGVAPVERSSAEVCAALREKYAIAPETFVFGILARIETYKGHLTIVEAAQRLKAEGRNFRVLIAGIGDYEAELRCEVEARGLSDTVTFLGFQQEVAPVLSVMDVQLNASYGTETSSLSVLEGMSMGLPAIVSDYGGNPWLIDDGEDGLIFPQKNAEALAAAMRRLMDEPETLHRLQEGCVRIFNERFTGKIFAENVERVYEDALKGDKR